MDRQQVVQALATLVAKHLPGKHDQDSHGRGSTLSARDSFAKRGWTKNAGYKVPKKFDEELHKLDNTEWRRLAKTVSDAYGGRVRLTNRASGKGAIVDSDAGTTIGSWHKEGDISLPDMRFNVRK